MKLWIRSQDRKYLIPDPLLGYNEKNGQHSILAYIRDEYRVIGTYKSEKRALEVLDELDEFIDLFNRKGFGNVLSDDGVHSKHTVYQIPKE